MARSVPSPIEENRETYVGGSQAHELFNEPLYGSGCARRLAYEKLQTPEDVPSESLKQKAIELRALFDRGHRLESVAVDIFTENTQRSLLRTNRLRRHPDHPGAAVHPDRFTVAFDERGTGDVEVKTKGEGAFLNILRNGLPPAHLMQLQWSLFCTQHRWGTFIVLGVLANGTLPLKYFDRDRDPALMNLFAHAVENFWNTLKAGDLPPQLDDPNDTRCKTCAYRLTCRGQQMDPDEHYRLLREAEGKKALTILQHDELNEAIADRALIVSKREALDHDDDKHPGALQLINQRIRDLMAELNLEAAEINHNWRVYCYDNHWSGVDVKRLERDLPEVYKEYYVTQRPTGRKGVRVNAIGEQKKRRAA